MKLLAIILSVAVLLFAFFATYQAGYSRGASFGIVYQKGLEGR